MKTFATLFTGGGGADCGLAAAGLTHLWGIEKNPAYAAIANLNGFKTLIQDVRSTDWMQLDTPDWLHASPPCQRASVANPKSGEGFIDIGLAQAVVAAIKNHRPKVFSLENVRGYKRFNSYKLICSYLIDAGYSITNSVLDSANYGVPQNRNRLWLVASRIDTPTLPAPTHSSDSNQLDLFYKLAPLVGWQEALFSCPFEMEIVKLTDRQRRMAPKEIKEPVLCTAWTQERLGRVIERKANEPCPTILSGWNRTGCLPKVMTPEMGKGYAKVLSLAHLSALQGFPKYYDWGESRPRAFEAIGNAVSPPMMHAIAKANTQSSIAA